MNKLKKILLWILANGAFAAFVYFGFYQNVEGARYVTIFYTWVIFFLSFLFLSPSVIKAMAEKDPSANVPRCLSIAYDIIVVTALVYAGAMWTGGVYFVHFFLMCALWGAVDDKRLKSAEAKKEDLK